LHIFWYTRMCTKAMQTLQQPAQSIAQWRNLALQFDAWAASLRQLRAHMAAMSAPVFIEVISPGALEILIERCQAAPPSGALAYVPFVVKDNIDVAGFSTTAACPAFTYKPEQSAWAVQQLQTAGALCLAKTNLDQFATGLVGTRSPYGAPSSVFDETLISGGSSSGSAVTVALGLVPFALGTDTAGSGRIPAMFNHIVGLKPTPGRVSNQGVVPACASLDCISVFALDVQDAAQVLAVMETPNPADTAWSPGPAAFAKTPVFGVPGTLPASVAPWVARAFEQSCAELVAAGYKTVPVDFDGLFQVAQLLYEGPWVAERHLVIADLLQREPTAIETTVAQVIGKATQFDAADTFSAMYRLKHLAHQAEQIWQQCDVLLMPTAPSHPSHAQLKAQPIAENSALGLFTNFVNLLGWSALALPVSRTQAQPFGVTLVAKAHWDAALASLGAVLQARWQQTPGLTEYRAVAAPIPLSNPASAVAASTAPLAYSTLSPIAHQAMMPIVVVGAHLAGLPLNYQLIERQALFAYSTTTAAHYQLYALPGTHPPKPGLQRVAQGGTAIAVEVWHLPVQHWASFMALIPQPLGIGRIEMADGQWLHGFLCEAHALAGAQNISEFKGWRAYMASLAKPG
jgi:allophanate hydrolase